MLATLMLFSALSMAATDGWLQDSPGLIEQGLPEDFSNRGSEAMHLGDPVSALVLFRRGLNQWPEEPRLQRQLSRAESLLQKTDAMPIAFPAPWLTRRNLSLFGAACLVLAAASYSIGERAGFRHSGLVGVLAVLLLFLCAVVIYQQGNAASFNESYLVRTTAPLRLGNGPDYDEVPVASPLCAGQEVHMLGVRGSWSHVACPDGTTGWLPTAVLVR
ncbi:MAG TPA: hypothetical protein VHR72_08340 [Gemmataceae bacterium]|jgi:hypothetical protein|nr:hypothetical protein [Gemmataceae bacterium]